MMSFWLLLAVLGVLAGQCKASSIPVCDLCLCTLTVADCSKKGMATVPLGGDDVAGGENGGVAALDFSFNLIPSLNQSTIVAYSSLKSLDLSYNLITLIERGSFDHLRSLRSLDLSNNLISTVLSDAFPFDLPLSSLTLHNNSLSELRENPFSHLSSLNHLDLSMNEIYSIDATVLTHGMTNLTLVNMSSNNLFYISNVYFPSNCQITIIDFSVNFIRDLSENCFINVKSLRTLNLRKNFISLIRASVFPSQSFLTSVDLSYNSLSFIEDFAFAATPNLTTLDLNHNRLKNLTVNMFSGLERLSSLNLASNAISSAPPETFSNMSHMRNLTMASNPYQCFISSLGNHICGFACVAYNAPSSAFNSTCSHVGFFSPSEACFVSCYNETLGLHRSSTFSCLNGTWEGELPNCNKTEHSRADSKSSSASFPLILGIVGLVLLAILVLFIMVFVLGRRRRREKTAPQLDAFHQNPLVMQHGAQAVLSTRFVDILGSDSVKNAMNEDYAHLFNGELQGKSAFLQLEVPLSRLEVGKKLGEGFFGVVCEGILKVSKGGKEKVAVKMVKPFAPLEEQQKIIIEALLMSKLAHSCLVRLVGVCSSVTPFYIITEFMKGGSLDSFLQDCDPATNKKPKMALDAQIMTSICMKVATAMAFLESKRIVHRDLAARNVLVGDSIDTIKLSDFGMARVIVEDSAYYRQQKSAAVPVKWMAPEAIKDKISTSQSDMWSFGVLIWEVFSYGAVPYGDQTPMETVNYVFGGKRLERPFMCPSRVVDVMTMCWEFEPENRPTFSLMVEALEVLQSSRGANIPQLEDLFHRRSLMKPVISRSPVKMLQSLTSLMDNDDCETAL